VPDPFAASVPCPAVSNAVTTAVLG